jgi:hypothetical protein
MTLNNTPFNWKNKTEFVPSNPQEKTMSTYDHLQSAEKSLRNALKTSVDISNVDVLQRITNTISAVNEIKNEHQYSLNNDVTHDGFFLRDDLQSPNTNDFIVG